MASWKNDFLCTTLSIYRKRKFLFNSSFSLIYKAGTKVGPDQLGPLVRVGSTRIDSDQLGSNKKLKVK